MESIINNDSKLQMYGFLKSMLTTNKTVMQSSIINHGCEYEEGFDKGRLALAQEQNKLIQNFLNSLHDEQLNYADKLLER